MRNNNKGFTLIELIIVTVILGILAAVAVPRYMGTVNRAEMAAENAVLEALEANVEAYATEHFIDHGRKKYPVNPFDGASVDGYDPLINNASNSGEWAFKLFSNGYAGRITHMRNDNSVWKWSFSSDDLSVTQGDDRGGFGERLLWKAGNDDVDSGTNDDDF